MPLDELKNVWAAHTALLERAVAIDERLLRGQLGRRMRLALVPQAAWRALQALLGALAVWFVLPVVASHIEQSLYLFAGGAVVAFLAVFTLASASLCVRALQLDLTAPVVAIQRDFERLRLAEYRATKWALLLGTAAWLPLPLLLLEAFAGHPVLPFVHTPWLVANVVFGLGLLVAGSWWSRRVVERGDCMDAHAPSPRARWWIDALSSRGVRNASRHLDELAMFAREEG